MEQAVRWNALTKPFRSSTATERAWVALTSFLPFVATSAFLMTAELGLWEIPLYILNAFFLVRVFIVQHDCGHGSFSRNEGLNRWVGRACSLLTMIPYDYWAQCHAFHHAHCGRTEPGIRDIGDITTYSVEEYQGLPRLRRFLYRLYRHPVILFGLGPLYYFLVILRLPLARRPGWGPIYWNQLASNFVLVTVWAWIAYSLGPISVLSAMLTTWAAFYIIAIWFFYVQHQHTETYRAPKASWNYEGAALDGSTHYDLPYLLHWLTGFIGYHHVHHLDARVPSQHLAACSDEILAKTDRVTSLGIRESFSTARNHLWDEHQGRMVSFGALKRAHAP